MPEDYMDTSMEIPSSSSSSEKYHTAESVECIFSSECSSQDVDAGSDISFSPTYKRYPDVIPHAAPFSQNSEADSGPYESDLDTTTVFVGHPTSPDFESTRISSESFSSDHIIDTISISGYLGSMESSLESVNSDYVTLTPEKSRNFLGSIPVSAECDTGTELTRAKDAALRAKEKAIKEQNLHRDQYKLIEQFFMALCEAVCLFMFLQALMVVLKKFDPQLTNIFACLTYNLSYCICIAVVIVLLGGTFVKGTAFVIKRFSSNWIRAVLLLVTIALVTVMFSTFCVIEYCFNSEWLKLMYLK